MPEHWLHVYQRPPQGNRFIGRWRAYDYQHRIAAAGGFDTADCEIAVSKNQAERFVEDYLGCRVAVFVDNPAQAIWEGFINRVTINAGTVVYSRSLDKMHNRVSGVYTNGGGTTAVTHLTAVNNLTSQGIYGIKEGSPENRVTSNTSTALNSLRDRTLSKQSYPQSSFVFSGQSRTPVIRLELKGFYWWLTWVKYFNSSASQTAVSSILNTMISGYPNTSFIDVSGSDIQTNSLTRHPGSVANGNTTYWDVVQAIQEFGDGTDAFVAGITPTKQDGTRNFYYRTANTDVDYILRSSDGKVRDIFGRIVKPWLVQPDRVARVNDILLGQYDAERDPRALYLDKVDYNAEGFGVQMASSDDLTNEGAFQLRFSYKSIGDRFGAEQRILA